MSKTQKSSKKNNTWGQHLINFVSILITGAGIGWLVGLSVSPVISIVITSVVGSVAAIIAALSGLTNNQQSENQGDKRNRLADVTPNPLPVAALVVGLVIGSWFGVQARTHNWLEPDIAAKMAIWEAQGIDSEDIRDRLYNLEFPSEAVPPSQPKTSTVSPDQGVLFAVSIEECDNLLGLTGEELKRELATSAANPELRELPNIIEDTEVLEELLEKVLCHDS